MTERKSPNSHDIRTVRVIFSDETRLNGKG